MSAANLGNQSADGPLADRASRGCTLEKCDGPPGFAVCIGSSEWEMLFIDWAPRGEELILLDTVRWCRDENAKMIAEIDMSYGDFLKWRQRMRSGDAWSHGKMFFRSDRLLRDVRALAKRARRSWYQPARTKVEKRANGQPAQIAA